MTLNDFQIRAGATDRSPGEDWYYALGLSGEAGEVAELVKKLHRQLGKWEGATRHDREYVDKIRGELGDVLWYLARMATLHGLSLAEVAQANLEKLARRHKDFIVLDETRGYVPGQWP